MGVSNRTRYEVLRRDNHSCRYCGAKAPHVALQVDHVIPRSRGGSDEAWNLTAACTPCNQSKGDGVPNEDVIREVRFDESCYEASKGYPVRPCMHCAKPVQDYPDDEPHECPQCETCNEMVSSAHHEGVKRGYAWALEKVGGINGA